VITIKNSGLEFIFGPKVKSQGQTAQNCLGALVRLERHRSLLRFARWLDRMLLTLRLIFIWFWCCLWDGDESPHQ